MKNQKEIIDLAKKLSNSNKLYSRETRGFKLNEFYN